MNLLGDSTRRSPPHTQLCLPPEFLLFYPAALLGSSALWSFFLMLWCWENGLGNVLLMGLGKPLVFALLCFVLQFLKDTLFQLKFVLGKQFKYFPFNLWE